MTKYYIENTNVDLSHLKDWELELIEKFKEVTKLCGEIYEAQINPESSFYPKGITIDEIEDAAVDDPTILSPYTRVIKEGKKLKAIFYYDEYSDKIDRIITLLKDASKIYSKNGEKKSGEYLMALCSDLKSANFESNEKIWLKISGDVNVDIKLGPLETYQDKLLGIKRTFQSNLRIRDEQEYSNLKDYIEVINAILPMSPFARDISESDFVVRIDKVIAMGGWHADLFPSSSNYPSDISYYKFGVKAVIYTNNIIKKQPQINKIVKTLIDSSYNDEGKLTRARRRVIIFHEISETISKVKYERAYEQLRNYRDPIIEVYADLMGLKSGAIHVLKGLMTVEEYQYLLVTAIACYLRVWFKGKISNALSVYSIGNRLIFNYLLERGAVKIYENKIQIDYPRMYTAIDNATVELSNIILGGNPAIAAELFRKYNSEKELSKFIPIIKNIIKQD